MPQFVKHFVQDLTQDIKVRQCGTIVFNGDNLSNVITVDLYNGTEPYSGGGSVSCSVICPDGATVPITNGSISGNTVTVTLTGDCFSIPGQIGVGVQVVNGDIRTTILKAIYNVELLETDTIVDPGSRITASVGQLVSDIEAATAEIPASDMASLMAGIAPTFSASINYNAGAYVYYNGTLYRFTADHAAGSWTGTDATAVALGNDLGGQVSDLKSALTTKANKIGSSPDLIAGTAEQLMSSDVVEDAVPYLYRKSGGGVDAGNREKLEKIIGGTVAWNQLCNGASVTVLNGHKYVSKVGTTWALGASTGAAVTGLTSGSDMVFDLTQMFGSAVADAVYAIEQANAGAGVAWFRSLFPNAYYAYNAGELISVSGLQSHDMIGFNQWDEEWELGIYDWVGGTGGKIAGSSQIRSKSHIVVLPNTTYYTSISSIYILFYDGNGNYIDKVSNTYQFTTPANCHSITFYCFLAYGTTYKNDICINISDPSRNGKYEPYEKHSYPLDSSLTLRGIPKWADGAMCFDGDEYAPDGKVSRKWSLIDLGTINWAYTGGDNSRFQANDLIGTVKTLSGNNVVARMVCAKYDSAAYNNVYYHSKDKIIAFSKDGDIAVYDTAYTNAQSFKTAMSGEMLLFELATPITETAEPYQEIQICSRWGTEEFITDSIVPVGHETSYPANLVEKLDGLPWNFSTLIAPTEETTTASRAYTVGSYLILSNVLYKVTSAIASGATITPNTNVRATTIMSEIMSMA